VKQGNITKNMAALGAFKLSWYIRQHNMKDIFEKYSFLLTEDVTEEDILPYQEKPEQLSGDCSIEQQTGYWKIYKLCHHNKVAMTALQLYTLCYMEMSTLQILRCVFGESIQGLTVEIAARITYVQDDYLDLYDEMEEAYECLKQIVSMIEQGNSQFRNVFVIEDRLIAFLSGQKRMDCKLARVGCYMEPADTISNVCIMEKQIQQTCMQIRLTETNSLRIVQIGGKRESGRRFAVRQIASRLRIPLLLIPLDYLFADREFQQERWGRVLRELLLTDRALCVYDEEDCKKEEVMRLLPFYRELEKRYANLDRPLFCTTGSSVKLIPFLEGAVFGFDIPKYSIRQSICLWEQAMKEYGMEEDELPISMLAGKLQLTAGQIRRVVRKAFQEIDKEKRSQDIYRICYKILDDGKYDNIKRITTNYTLDDMKIGAIQKKTLIEICNQMIYRLKVLDEWKMREKYVYGRGLTVLFYGLPGTGKTMGAHVLSSMLGLELYKVDLSQIADKYIGETEKRLEQVFQRAENSNMILFFDEADALLGKRGEVKEGRDKYANAEVSYLLQRMEEYDGIVIMATNLAANIDKAFMRRFRFAVQFPMPDVIARKEIWESLLYAGEVPRDSLDVDYLAEQFEFSGANIKNVVWNALFRAASDGIPLNMKHMLVSVDEEQRKNGKIWSPEDFGKYYYLIDEIN